MEGWPTNNFTILARDQHRDVEMKSVVKAFTFERARESFERAYPPSRYPVREVRFTIDFELDHVFPDGDTLRELLAMAEEGEIVCTTDLD
jgi:hypothetical protein